jgi:hypothetical protein
MSQRKNARLEYHPRGWCDHCYRFEVPTIMIGEAPSYESNTVTLCEECLVLGLAALRAAGIKP